LMVTRVGQPADTVYFILQINITILNILNINLERKISNWQ